jgi:hypothetical protein
MNDEQQQQNEIGALGFDISRAAADVEVLAANGEQHAAAKAKVMADQRLTPEAKRADVEKLEADFSQRFNGRSQEAQARLTELSKAAQQQIEALREKAMPKPKDVTQWQEASARAQFIREDLAAHPEQAASMLRAAVKSGDTIAAYLINRYGGAEPKTQEEARAYSDLMRAQSELFKPDEKAQAALKAEMQRLNDLRSRLPVAATREEKNEFAARFGLKT